MGFQRWIWSIHSSVLLAGLALLVLIVTRREVGERSHRHVDSALRLVEASLLTCAVAQRVSTTHCGGPRTGRAISS